MFDICTTGFIFQIDGDEIPSIYLIKEFKKLFTQSRLRFIFVSRKNYIVDLSHSGLRYIDNGKLNYIWTIKVEYLKTTQILDGKVRVHERITGYKKSHIIKNDHVTLIHKKNLKTHVDNNKKYIKLKYKPSNTDVNICVISTYFNQM